MGIEKFFNTLLTSYKSKLIIPFTKTSADILFFDFNSIIHKISAQTVSDLNYLYKILLIASKYPSQKLINYFINKYKNYESIFYLSIDFIHTPSGILQLIQDLKNIDINTVIIYQIIKQIEFYISQISELQLVYISLDGVPSIGKILEQRHRRYIGEIINHQNVKKINSYKYPVELSENYPYDYPAYYNTKFTFAKLNISPNTTFIKKLIKSIKNHTFPVSIQINDDNISGEGEFKIINFINIYSDIFLNKKIIIYSPDSDMILLSSILPHDIYILRYDQQENIDYIMSTEIFKKLLVKYIHSLSQNTTQDSNKDLYNENIVKDIIFIFTIFGDDFLPKLETINVKNNYDTILHVYQHIYQDGYILDKNTIHISQLKKFFIELEKKLNISNKTEESYLRKKKSSFNNDPLDGPIINNINKDLHNSNYLEDKYSVTFYTYPPKQYYEKYNMTAEQSAKEYITGFVWIYNYYFNGKLNYSWYYPYEKSPLLSDINNYLQSIQTIDEIKIKDDYPLLLTPIEQAIYTSPIDITHVLSKKYRDITHDFYKTYNISNILDKIDKLDCNNSSYLSKCSLTFLTDIHPIYKLSPTEFIKLFRSQSSTNKFLKYVEYYKITNDPYFYDLIKKLM